MKLVGFGKETAFIGMRVAKNPAYGGSTYSDIKGFIIEIFSTNNCMCKVKWDSGIITSQLCGNSHQLVYCEYDNIIDKITDGINILEKKYDN